MHTFDGSADGESQMPDHLARVRTTRTIYGDRGKGDFELPPEEGLMQELERGTKRTTTSLETFVKPKFTWECEQCYPGQCWDGSES